MLPKLLYKSPGIVKLSALLCSALSGAVPADGHGQGRVRVGGGDQERLPADRTAAEHSRPHLVGFVKVE